jgi:hypothetical protein
MTHHSVQLCRSQLVEDEVTLQIRSAVRILQRPVLPIIDHNEIIFISTINATCRRVPVT